MLKGAQGTDQFCPSSSTHPTNMHPGWRISGLSVELWTSWSDSTQGRVGWFGVQEVQGGLEEACGWMALRGVLRGVGSWAEGA